MDGEGKIANRLRIGAAIEVVATKTVQLQIEQSERQPMSVIGPAGGDA